MNTYQVAKRLVKALESKGLIECIGIIGKKESLAGWGQDGVRIHDNYGGFLPFPNGVEEFAREWLQDNAPTIYAEPCDGGECLTLYEGP